MESNKDRQLPPHHGAVLTAQEERAIKQIVADMLVSSAREIEASVLTSITAVNERFQRDTQAGIAESRDKIFTQLLATHGLAATSVAQNQSLAGRLDVQDGYIRGIVSRLDTLLGEKTERTEAETRSDGRRQAVYNWMRWLGTVAGSTGIAKWLIGHYQHKQ